MSTDTDDGLLSRVRKYADKSSSAASSASAAGAAGAARLVRSFMAVLAAGPVVLVAVVALLGVASIEVEPLHFASIFSKLSGLREKGI